MGHIKNIRRFHCHLCEYITEDENKIKMIEELGEKCPACGNGKTKKYEAKIKEIFKT